MIRKFFTGGHAFDNRFFRVRDRGIKFDVEPFFHGADDEEADTAGEDDTIWCDANQYFGPVRYFGQYLIEYQDQFG